MPVLGIRAARDSIRYGFAVGRVRVLETKVFGAATFERLVDAPDFAEQLRILSDTVYGRYLAHAQTADDVERGLDEALDDFYGFLDGSNLPPSVVRSFRVRYDFQNLKGALKADLLGVPPTEMLVGLGTIAVEEFALPLEDLPEPLGSLAEEIAEREAGEESRRARLSSASVGEASGGAARAREDELVSIDATVDRAMFVELARLAKESRSRFLRGLVRLEIDIANVKALLRARLSDLAFDRAREFMVEGGSISAKELEELYSMPFVESGERLASLPALRGMQAGELSSPERLDVIADNIVVAYLREARQVTIGAEPVIAYVMGRQAEVRAVRTLLMGKLAELDESVLRARLRDLYV